MFGTAHNILTLGVPPRTMHVAVVEPPGAVERDLAYGCWHRRKWVSYHWPPLHLGYVAAVLQRSGHEVSLLEANALGAGAIVDRLEDLAPDVVVAGTSTRTFRDDSSFLSGLGDGVARVLFGDLPSVRPDAVLTACDAAVVGEAEAVLPDLLHALEDGKDGADITGVRVRRKGCTTGSGRGVITDLDSLPLPARHLYLGDYSNPLAVRTPFTTVLASRGCPHGCTFCTARIVQGRTFRTRSTANIAQELDLLEAHGYREVFFRDENIAHDKAWFLAVADDLAARDMVWMANARADALDEDVVDAMADSGCHLVKLGVESGSQHVLDSLGKGSRVDDARRAVALCKDRGVSVLAHFLMGAPGQTVEDLQRTADFALELDCDLASFDLLLPLPGTPLFDRLVTEGRISLDDVLELPATQLAARSAEATAAELEDAYASAFRRFYLRPRLVARHALAAASPERAAALARATGELWRGLA